MRWSGAIILTLIPRRIGSHQNADAGWATVLLTETAFVRLSMNPQVVGVSLDCSSAVGLLKGLVAHPSHQFAEDAPSLIEATFDDLASKVTGYRQVSDATLLHIARTLGMQLVTFDSSISAICPWPQQLLVLTP